MHKPFFYDDDFMWETLRIHEMPTALYQYTSIDSLEKILQNKTMRFSRLDTVNDPEEATASDVPHAATSVVVSCWTTATMESIPMWSMYGDSFRGVRIKMPTNMFCGRDKPRVFEKGGALMSVKKAADGTFPLKVERKPPAMTLSTCGIIGPNKVHYSNEPQYRNPQIIHTEGNRAYCYTYDLGMVKSEHWSYEEEWRFKISWFNGENNVPDDPFFRSITIDLKNYPILTEQLFVPLDETVFNEVEVTKGPLMTAPDEKRLNEIMSTFANVAKVECS